MELASQEMGEHMHKFSFKEWSIQVVPAKGSEWGKVVASRDIDAGSRRMKKSNGVWTTIPAARKKYVIGWNGKRFAVGAEYKAIRKQHNALFLAICEELGVTP